MAAPNFATTVVNDERHRFRSLAFPLALWQGVLDGAFDTRFSFDGLGFYGRKFDSSATSNQVLARVFIRHERMSPSDYRRAARDPARPSILIGARPALEGRP